MINQRDRGSYRRLGALAVSLRCGSRGALALQRNGSVQAKAGGTGWWSKESNESSKSNESNHSHPSILSIPSLGRRHFSTSPRLPENKCSIPLLPTPKTTTIPSSDMNSFENAIYTILDACITSDAGLVIFLLGGFVLCGIFSILLLTPWLRQIPHRFYLSAGAALPVIVLIYAYLFELLVKGRKPAIMLALSPVLIAFIPSVASLVCAIRRYPMPRRTLIIIVLAIVIFAQLWTTLVLWLATNHGFMGASC